MADKTRPPLDSVHRALQLLVALRERSSLSVKEASELLEVVPSTAHRLLAALCHDGFAVQDEDRRYRSGPELARVGRGLSVQQLREAARRPLETLSRTLDETAQLWVLQGARVRYVDGVEGMQPLSVRTGGWDNVPAAASAAGRAMLAELNHAEIQRIHGDSDVDWAKSRTTSVEALEALLAKVLSQGYALSLEEAVAGVNGVAASVRSRAGVPVAAISVAVPTARITDDHVAICAQALRVAVNATEHALASRFIGGVSGSRV